MHVDVDRHDSPLGRWTLARWDPASSGGAVDGIWYFEGSLRILRERHFPHGLVHLVVHLGPRYHRVLGDRTERFSPACLSGLLLRPDVIQAPPGPTAVLGLLLRPAGAYAVLGRPVHELTEHTVDLEDFLPGAAAELTERCAVVRSPEDRVRSAAAWIDARLRVGCAADAAVAWMARELERHAGAVTIRELRDRTGWSKTRLTERFREQVGVPPKTLARVLRFRRAMELLRRGEHSLAEIALVAGYYDQPHFNREFRELAELTPSEYLARKRFPETVSLPEASE